MSLPCLAPSREFLPPLESNLRTLWCVPPSPNSTSPPTSFSLCQDTEAFSSEQANPFLSWGLCSCCSFCQEPLLWLLHVASFLPFRSELKCHEYHLLSEAFSDPFFLKAAPCYLTSKLQGNHITQFIFPECLLQPPVVLVVDLSRKR